MIARPLRMLLGALLLAPPAAAVAQSAGQAPTVLLVPAGTRAVGLGDAYVAGDGPEALFYNPAQFGTRGSTVSLARLGGSATLGALATAGRVLNNTVAIGVRFLDYGAELGQFPMPAGALPLRGPIDGTSFDAMVALQRSYFGIRFGAAGHYVSEQQQLTGRTDGVLFDAGAGRDVLGVTVGVSVQNLGGSLELGGVSADPPTRVSLGGLKDGIRVGTFFDLAVAASVSLEAGGRMVPGAGAELTWEPVAGWTFAGRVGVRRGDPAGAPGLSPVSFGGSFGLDALHLDYAFTPYHGVAGGSHRIGLRIQ
jgi:hypothetical protein